MEVRPQALSRKLLGKIKTPRPPRSLWLMNLKLCEATAVMGEVLRAELRAI
jgi:hypothetical protein